jgi:hypothetical protein
MSEAAIASLYRDHMTRGRSGHLAAHWSLILPACFFGQSAVISPSQSITLASCPRCSITVADAAGFVHVEGSLQFSFVDFEAAHSEIADRVSPRTTAQRRSN